MNTDLIYMLYSTGVHSGIPGGLLACIDWKPDTLVLLKISHWLLPIKANKIMIQAMNASQNVSPMIPRPYSY